MDGLGERVLSGPALWYLNRGTGVVLLVLYTLVVVLGIAGVARRPGVRRLPQFAVQGLHRSLAGLATGLLLAHIVTAVVDTYVDIRWWDALVPFGGLYRPLYLAAGALAVDLLIAVVLTSLAKRRLSDRAWRLVHLAAYPSWAASLVHTVGIGTDVTTPWLRWILVGCVATVAAATVARLVRGRVVAEQA